MPAVITKTTVAALLACVSLGVFGEVPPLTGAAETPAAAPDASAPLTAPPAVSAADEVEEVVIAAPEPRYVAPTRRDQIGRIWAPVFINNQGPFRLVLDTGANRSCVIAKVASRLQLTPDHFRVDAAAGRHRERDGADGARQFAAGGRFVDHRL